MSITVDGQPELTSTLRAAGAELDANLDAAGRRSSQLIADKGKALAPKRSGRLAETVRPGMAQAGASTVTAGSPSVVYAAIVHKRDPFLTKALEQTESQVITEHEQAVAQAVDTIRGAS